MYTYNNFFKKIYYTELCMMLIGLILSCNFKCQAVRALHNMMTKVMMAIVRWLLEILDGYDEL